MVEPQDPIMVGGQIWLSEPMTFLTDAILAGFCGWWALTFSRQHPNPTVRPWWVSFFALMGIATFLGGVGHGLSHTPWAMSVKLVGWYISAASVLSAEIASVRVLPQPVQRWLGAFAWIQFVVFVFALGWFQYFDAVKINSAVGLMGLVAPIHLLRHFNGQRGSGIIAAGIFSAIAAALVSGFQLSPHKWFNYHDLGHLCMMGSLWLIYTGARRHGLVVS